MPVLSYFPYATATGGVSTVLDENSWATISAVSAASEGPNYWSVGDTKKIHIEGTVGTLEINEDFYVYILGFDHNADLEGKGITFGGFKTADGGLIDVALCDRNYGYMSTSGGKYFQMNHWGTQSYGGWRASDIRYDVLGSTDSEPSGYGAARSSGCMGYDASDTCATNPVTGTLMAALPEDLREQMKPMTVYADGVGGASTSSTGVVATVDYLPLLAEFEIFGIRAYANIQEIYKQQQYSYYANGGETVKNNHTDTSSAVIWRVRSDYTLGTNTAFCIVRADGTSYYAATNYSYGLAPIFRV